MPRHSQPTPAQSRRNHSCAHVVADHRVCLCTASREALVNKSSENVSECQVPRRSLVRPNSNTLTEEQRYIRVEQCDANGRCTAIRLRGFDQCLPFLRAQRGKKHCKTNSRCTALLLSELPSWPKCLQHNSFEH